MKEEHTKKRDGEEKQSDEVDEELEQTIPTDELEKANQAVSTSTQAEEGQQGSESEALFHRNPDPQLRRTLLRRNKRGRTTSRTRRRGPWSSQAWIMP